MEATVERLCNLRAELGEGPVWDANQAYLYSLDIESKRAFRYSPTQDQLTVVDLPFRMMAMGLAQDGLFIVSTDAGVGLWAWGSSRFTLLGNPETNHPPARFNDGAVDPQGRFWVGMLGYERNPLYRVEPDGSICQMDDDIRLSNGIHWNPDGTVMYLADSLRRAIFAYDFQAGTGSISNRRVAVDTSAEAGVPDGITVDSAGYIWVAMCGGWQVIRYSATGIVDRRIIMPVECPTSCTLGGAEGNDLYVTSSRSLIQPGTISQQLAAGDVFRVKVPQRGQRESVFGRCSSTTRRTQ